MNIVKFIKILVPKFKYIVILPVFIGGIVFFLTKDLPVQYAAETSIFTGITSNSGLSVEATRVDNVATQNDYNNVLSILKSKALFEEVGLRLLTQHLMLDKPQKDIISEKSFNELKANVPDKIKKLIVKGDFNKSFSNISGYVKQDEKNYLYKLLNYSDPHYSVNAISNLKSERVNSSDLIKLSFESDDAGISYNTLKIIATVFIKDYGQLKSNQSSSAVAYFEQKLKEISDKLNDAEDRLLKFNVESNTINYYEQTKQVTTQQEKIEVRLQEVKMECEAADAVLNKIEAEVAKRYKVNLRNRDILSIREQLIYLNNKQVESEINNKSDNSLQQDFTSKKLQLEEKLKNKIDSIYIFETKSQGLESQKILTEWLDAVKNHESYTALYKSMKERQADFMTQYKKYAPEGATIKRLEREIDVDEREYLNVLVQLGLAKQKQQNVDMVSNMKIIDEPKMPINAIPSKKKLYVIIAALFTAIFYILGIFIVELLDHRIKTPLKLKELSGYDVIGAFCMIDKKKFINTEKISETAAKFICEKISLNTENNTNKPIVIQLFSSWENNQLSFCADTISNQLQKHGYNTKIVNFEENKQNDKDTKQFINIKSYSEFDDNASLPLHYIISIIPPISKGFDNTNLLKTGDLNFIIYDADVTWSEADTYILDKFKKLISKTTYSILTNAIPDNLEEMYGEIPKKRSAFRVFAKKMVSKVS